MSLLHIAGGATEGKLDASDVFSAYVRTGTGADVTVTTNIDMTKGYMVWTKGRSDATDHAIYDSARGVTYDLVTNSTAAQTTQATGLKAVSTTGHTIGSLAKMNTSAATYVDYVWRKAPKFFDIVTYTGDGNATKTISHSLGIKPGMIIVKNTITSGKEWTVYHRSINSERYGFLLLNGTNAAFTSTAYDWNPTETTFEADNQCPINELGQTYVAYLFAHDPSADGIIQCGSFTETGSLVNVNLGWEPQYLLIKRTNGTGNWWVFDTMRGWVDTTGANSQYLCPNLSQAEIGVSNWLSPTATGFKAQAYDGSGATWAYVAIRRPNKVPTSGTEVFHSQYRTATTTEGIKVTTGFPVDLQIQGWTGSSTGKNFVVDRLRGVQTTSANTATTYLKTHDTAAETTITGLTEYWDNTGYGESNVWRTEIGAIFYNFKRAKGFFDIVCYTGTGVARTVNHNLGVVPELLIIKSRSATGDWQVWFNGLSATEKLVLNTTAAKITDATLLNSTLPTSTLISLGTQAAVNTSAATYVAYAFASIAGIQSIGTYTGNGSTQNLNFGFTTGARFFLCKAVTTTGSYWIFDSVRGIVASTDFGLQLNSTAAEVTSADCVDPLSSGISVVEEGTCHLNTNGIVYMYWAIA